MSMAPSHKGVLAIVYAFSIAGCTLLTDLDGLVGEAGEVRGEDGGGDAAESGSDAGVVSDVPDVPITDAATVPPDSSNADAPTSDAALPVFVQSSTASLTGDVMSMASGLLNPVRAGDLIVVVFQSEGLVPVASMTDNATDGGPGNIYRSAGQRSQVYCAAAGSQQEIWYARMVVGGATRVNLTIPPGGLARAPKVWVLDFSGVGDVVGGGVTGEQPVGAIVTAPPVSTGGQAVVVSTAITCEKVVGIHAGNPFTLLPLLSGDAVAYYVASRSGAYGAVFDSDPAAWAASTASFR